MGQDYRGLLVPLCPLLGRPSSFIPATFRLQPTLILKLVVMDRFSQGILFRYSALHTDILVKDLGSCVFCYQLKYPRKGLSLEPSSQAQRPMIAEKLVWS